MRPIKLTMTAFGPYKDREVIDFTELDENRIFVISGNTGAGKTTIFDAICFVLYGAASGEDRSDVKGLRSDFADDDVHTSVELEFELRGHLYRIKRQLSHVKKGNKTATGEAYEFYEKIGEQEIPCVDRQIVSEINKKVEELVGLTRDQFIQIVMLPQGEFRKLLTSQTENKEEILRKIFKTERYSFISQRLKEKKQQAEDDFTREKQTRDRYFSDIQTLLPARDESTLFATLAQENFNTYQVLDGLDEESVYYEKSIEANKQNEKLAEAAYHKKLEEYHKAEGINEEFKNLEEKENHLKEERAKEPIFKEKKVQLENAERAGKIESYENQVNEWRKDEKEKSARFQLIEKSYHRTVQTLQTAEASYKEQESKKAEREEIRKKLDGYKEFLPLVQEIDMKKQELIEQQKNVQNLAKKRDSIVSTIQEQKEKKQKLNDQIKGLEIRVDTLPDKQQKLIELRNQATVLKGYLKLQRKQAEMDKDVKTKENQYSTAKQKYETMEAAWINGQAIILASHLHDGEACPVCGSTEHPNKAGGHVDVPTKDALDAAKIEFNQIDGAYRDSKAKYNTLKAELEEKAIEVRQLGFHVQNVEATYIKMVEDGKKLSAEVDSLQSEKEKLARLKTQLEKLETNLSRMEKQQESATEDYQLHNTAYQANKAVYQEQLNRIPEDLRQLSVLKAKIADTETIQKTMEQAWEQAQKQIQSAKEEVAKAKVNLENAKLALDESRKKKEKAEQQFIEMLHKAGFSNEETYRQAKMAETSQKQLKAEIESYYNNIASLQLLVKDLHETLKDKHKIDLNELKTELDQLKQAFDQAQEQLRQSEQYLQHVKKLQKNIFEANERVTEFERRKNIVADLYDVIRGQNDKKISFERYLQIEFLEQILIAANERLKRLSNGQYVLLRSERQEARGKQSGLGLDIYDSYTGQTRDVKTLSGGEKFNASLSLALGMADVIQSYQGGVSIDTMFIDEGFGSLDEESLTKAIDTLIDLQQTGRMIGIISHVQELKNAIPAILEVNKTKEGYSKTQFVIK
ncbi:SMC family ATPase [Caldifermentibacillus hisashii]|uniref:Nuclease SbcCD subunit C n=1 Tax=Caldifermentibacillus hisashii TaxID=996558 RepID=A0ABU9JUZ5_9BACI